MPGLLPNAAQKKQKHNKMSIWDSDGMEAAKQQGQLLAIPPSRRDHTRRRTEGCAAMRGHAGIDN